VEIASGGQRETVSDLVLQLVAAFPYALGIELVFAIGMRSGDDVSDAVGDGHFGHLHRFFERGCAIIEARKDVTVNVHHHVKRISEVCRGNNCFGGGAHASSNRYSVT
jgi:hypothetical protein